MESERPFSLFAFRQNPPVFSQPSYVSAYYQEPAEKQVPVFGRDLGMAFGAVTEYYQRAASDLLEHKKLRRRQYYTDPRVQGQRGQGTTVHGDILLQRMRECLAIIGHTRSEDQKKFHHEFERAIAPGLYGPTFEIEYQRILKENGWKSVRPQAMVITPRRWGKTWATAMFVCAYVLSVPNGVQCIFSTSSRVSEMFLELVFRFIVEIDGAKEKVIKHTKEALWIRGDHSGDIRKVYSYPSNPKIWTSANPSQPFSFLFILPLFLWASDVGGRQMPYSLFFSRLNNLFPHHCAYGWLKKGTRLGIYFYSFFYS